MKENPFGDDADSPSRTNPFGDDEAPTADPGEAADRIEYAAKKIRYLRSQLGSDGLSVPATRELIDQLSRALDTAARALRGLAD